MKQVEADLPSYRAAAQAVREHLLTNLVMLGEIPSPTFGEERRMAFLRQRFTESGLQDISYDEAGNCIGVLPGKNPDRYILLVAHADTLHPEEVDHTIQILPDRVKGVGLSDNSLGLAVLASLPELLRSAGAEFDAGLILMGASRSLGRGNLEGIRFFLENNPLPVQSGICIEGVQLGRLSIDSIGMIRAEITCRVPDEYDWTRFGASGAIVALNEVINRMVEIPIPRRPRTSIEFGSIRGGTSFNTRARKASLRFEIRSESASQVRLLRDRINTIAAEVKSRAGAEVNVDIIARRKPGGISLDHPLAKTTRDVMALCGIEPRIFPSTSELSALIDKKIPAVTIGITRGEDIDDPDEAVLLEPMIDGLSQLLGVLASFDRGNNDED